ncbi:CS1 type fimbrial major subunit [Yersinia frederiksenii]|uniref:CS1 type fimbrial major subunit n=1 Tax=Yersinia frederiksenii TaxID=29484 RepID=UPI0025AB1414|nr:CS1 type fimbrial major subunit [Yersinia frederiksenii]MDN0119110.1 CS1 type fimbrial major subunit [Yersinia frederiksenii]
MKKTLLSIITMATLVGSMAAYADPLEKEIPVSATINGEIIISSNGGAPFGNDTLELEYNSADKKHTFEELISIESNTGDYINVTYKDGLTLQESISGNSKEFKNVTVKLAGQKLIIDKAEKFNLISNKLENKLNITAEQPDDAKENEIYSGTLKLSIEAGV